MNKLLALVALTTLTGCEMSYEEVKQKEAYCTDRGLYIVRYYTEDRKIVEVQCQDKAGFRFTTNRRR